MLKNKNNIFFSTDSNENIYLPKYCEWPNCNKKGEYKAPTSRSNLRHFKWFCLEHVKLYNKSWDYFKGKTSDEIYNEISKDATWHRPTYKRVKSINIEDSFNFINNSKNTSKKKVLSKNEDKLLEALAILDMQIPENIEVLKKQYKRLVKKFHPDINKENDKEYIIKLNEAYSTLIKLFKS